MGEKISNIIIIVTFVAIITIPQILDWMLDINNEIVATTENRKLSEKPELKFTTITEYPERFDSYWNDNLPFRTSLRELWVNLNYDLFHTTVDDKVIIGKENWLFYNSKTEMPIEQTQGILKFTEEEKCTILQNLQKWNDKLKNNNIQFEVLILPNKENLYREYLPDSIKIQEEKTRTEELIEFIKENSDIKVTYPKEELLEQKNNHQVYMKYDTHWNSLGALIGTIETYKSITGEQCFDINSANIIIKDEKETNDLATMINLQNKLYENNVVVDNFYSDITYTERKEGYLEICESDSDNDKTMLFIGDSFRVAMKPYLSKIYKKVVYVHRDYYDETMLEKVNPDIVILEAVERYSNALETIKIN